MSRTIISTKDAPVLPAPLSQGVRKGGLVQVAGQLPLDPATGNIVGSTVAEQTAQVLRNVTAVLEAADVSLEDVLILRVYLTDPAHLAEMNHGPKFWALVERLIPAMKEDKRWLQVYGLDLHRYGSTESD